MLIKSLDFLNIMLSYVVLNLIIFSRFQVCIERFLNPHAIQGLQIMILAIKYQVKLFLDLIGFIRSELDFECFTRQ